MQSLSFLQAASLESAAIALLQPWSQYNSPQISEVSASSSNNPLLKTLLPDTVCLDGSPFYAYIRPASNPSSANKFAMFLEGGGLCVERVDCHNRANTTQGSSLSWGDAVEHTDNILATDEANPFYDWNHVFMRYCSGDTWTGTNTLETGPGRFGLYFNGHEQVAAALDLLERDYGLGEQGSEFILAGASAGGIGTNNNCDYIAERFPNSAVMCSPQAGLFFPPSTTNLALDRLNVSLTMNQIGGWYVSNLFSSYHDRSCVEHAKNNGEPEQFCWEAGYLTPYITTPTLAAQNFWDQLQIDTILCFQDNLSHLSCPRSFLSEFKKNTLTAFDNLANFGYFMPSCFVHTDNLCLLNDEAVTRVQGVSYLEAMKAWYKDIENPPRLVDNCHTGLGFRDNWTPCNDVCSMSCQ